MKKLTFAAGVAAGAIATATLILTNPFEQPELNLNHEESQHAIVRLAASWIERHDGVHSLEYIFDDDCTLRVLDVWTMPDQRREVEISQLDFSSIDPSLTNVRLFADRVEVSGQFEYPFMYESGVFYPLRPGATPLRHTARITDEARSNRFGHIHSDDPRRLMRVINHIASLCGARQLSF